MENHPLQKAMLKKLASDYGTPLYIYDAYKIKQQIETFRKAFSEIDMRLFYAMKANSNLSILKWMKHLGTGVDTVSINELEIALKAGFRPEDIVFTPNMVHFDEIEQAVEKGVFINIENLSNLEKLGKAYGHSVPCFIRINPLLDDKAGKNKVEAWHKQSKFGIALQQFDRVHDLVNRYGIPVIGLHLHASHVIMSREVFLRGAQIVFELAKEFSGVKYLDFGGGLRPEEPDNPKVFDVFALAEAFREKFYQFRQETGRKLQLWFEPGRFLMRQAGYLLVQTEVVKSNGVVDFAGVNSGFNHLIRPMFYGSWHNIVNISHPAGKKKKYNVVGNLCEIDNFAIGRPLNEVREGDLLLVENAGAYGFSMSSHYNSRFKPAEVMIVNDKPFLIRKRDTLDDLLRNQIEIDF